MEKIGKMTEQRIRAGYLVFLKEAVKMRTTSMTRLQKALDDRLKKYSLRNPTPFNMAIVAIQMYVFHVPPEKVEFETDGYFGFCEEVGEEAIKNEIAELLPLEREPSAEEFVNAFIGIYNKHDRYIAG